MAQLKALIHNKNHTSATQFKIGIHSKCRHGQYSTFGVRYCSCWHLLVNKGMVVISCKSLLLGIYICVCVGPTKGTFRRDIKMIVNHDYIKQCIIFAKIFFVDYTSKYCLLSIKLSFECIYTPQHTNIRCFVCACCEFRIIHLKLIPVILQLC